MPTRPHHCFRILVLTVSLLIASSSAYGQATAFIYQGRLTEAGNPANGVFDMQFKLFNMLTGGAQVGGTITNSMVNVDNGVFAIQLNFFPCASCFDGSARFLEISIRPAGSVDPYTVLSPRQPIMSAPYAIKSQTAATADGLSVACLSCVTSSQIQSVNGSAVSGTIPVASLPAGSSNYIQNSTTQQAPSNFNISGNGIVGGTLSVGNAGTSARVFLNRASSIAANSADINFFSAGTPDFSLGTSQGSATPSDFSIYNYGTGSNALTIQKSSGFVGIGTTTPQSKLHINQTQPNAFATWVRTTGVATSSYGLLVEAGTDELDSALQINSQSGTPFMRIRGNGNIGIGTTNPLGKFDIRAPAGSTDLMLFVWDGVNPLVNFNVNGQGELQAKRGFFTQSLSTQLGNDGKDSVCVDGLTLAFCSSSLRYKTNIGQYRGGMDLIERLKPITFDWKNGGRHDLGLAAEDVEKVEPLLVTYNQDGQVEGVKYDRINVVLINAVIELKADNDALRQQLKQQEERLRRLEAAMSKLAGKN